MNNPTEGGVAAWLDCAGSRGCHLLAVGALAALRARCADLAVAVQTAPLEIHVAPLLEAVGDIPPFGDLSVRTDEEAVGGVEVGAVRALRERNDQAEIGTILKQSSDLAILRNIVEVRVLRLRLGESGRALLVGESVELAHGRLGVEGAGGGNGVGRAAHVTSIPLFVVSVKLVVYDCGSFADNSAQESRSDSSESHKASHQEDADGKRAADDDESILDGVVDVVVVVRVAHVTSMHYD